MKSLPSIPWPRIFAEGAIIVISILLAFAIDAWWDDRNAQQDEAIYLSTLRSVLIEQQREINVGLAFADELRDATRKILGAAVGSDAALTDDELDRALERLTWIVASPIEPELRWLLSENRIGLVSDPELVNELGTLRLNIFEWDRSHTATRSFYYDDLMPYLRKHASLPQINSISGQEPGTSDQFPVHERELRERVSHQFLLQDQEFTNLLQDFEWRLTNVIDWRTTAIEGEDVTGVGRVLNLLEQQR